MNSRLITRRTETSSPRTRKLFSRPAIPLLKLAVHAAKKAGTPTRASEDVTPNNAMVVAEGIEDIVDRHVAAKFKIIQDGLANEFRGLTDVIKEHVSDTTACAISYIRDCTESNEALARSEEREAALLAEREETRAKHDADIKAANDRVHYLERQLAAVNAHTTDQKEQIAGLVADSGKLNAYNKMLERALDVEILKVKNVEADQRESERRAATSEAKYNEAVAHTAELERRIGDIQKDSAKRELTLTQQLVQAGDKAAEQYAVLGTAQRRVAALMNLIDRRKISTAEAEIRALKGRVESAQAELTDVAQDLQASNQTGLSSTTHANSLSTSNKIVSDQDGHANLTPLAGTSRAANIANPPSTTHTQAVLRESKYKNIGNGKSSQVSGIPLPMKDTQCKGKAKEVGKENAMLA